MLHHKVTETVLVQNALHHSVTENVFVIQNALHHSVTENILVNQNTLCYTVTENILVMQNAVHHKVTEKVLEIKLHRESFFSAKYSSQRSNKICSCNAKCFSPHSYTENGLTCNAKYTSPHSSGSITKHFHGHSPFPFKKAVIVSGERMYTSTG